MLMWILPTHVWINNIAGTVSLSNHLLNSFQHKTESSMNSSLKAKYKCTNVDLGRYMKYIHNKLKCF